MEISEGLKTLTEQMRQDLGADKMYVIDFEKGEDEQPIAGLVFGVRNSATALLTARMHASKLLRETTKQPIDVEVLSDPIEEVEYLFDKYLRTYIASHGGVVTPIKAEEEEGKLWINMDGGCSGCPASLATLKHGIERTLKKHLPWIKQVVPTNEAVEPDFGIKLNLFSGLKKEDN